MASLNLKKIYRILIKESKINREIDYHKHLNLNLNPDLDDK